MEKADYISLLTKHLQDEQKFRPLTYDPTHILQTKNNNIVRELLNNRQNDETSTIDIHGTTPLTSSHPEDT